MRHSSWLCVVGKDGAGRSGTGRDAKAERCGTDLVEREQVTSLVNVVQAVASTSSDGEFPVERVDFEREALISLGRRQDFPYFRGVRGWHKWCQRGLVRSARDSSEVMKE